LENAAGIRRSARRCASNPPTAKPLFLAVFPFCVTHVCTDHISSLFKDGPNRIQLVLNYIGWHMLYYLLHASVDRRSWGGSWLMHVIRTDETSGQFPFWVPHGCPLMAQLLPSQGMLWSDRHAAFALPLLAATLHLDGLCVCLCLAVARLVFRMELSWPRSPATWLATFGLLPRLASLLWLPWNFFRRWHCLFAASP
jgi:hypothetical protein